jgi:hypothetical protein
MEKLFRDPTNSFYELVMEKVKELCNKYLVEQDVVPPLEIMDKWNKNEADFLELPLVRKSVIKLKQMVENPPAGLFSRIDDMCNALIVQFTANIDTAAFFIPTKEKSLAQLQGFVDSKMTLATQRLKVRNRSAVC